MEKTKRKKSPGKTILRAFINATDKNVKVKEKEKEIKTRNQCRAYNGQCISKATLNEIIFTKDLRFLFRIPVKKKTTNELPMQKGEGN